MSFELSSGLPEEAMEKAVTVAAHVIAGSPAIDAPKLPARCWHGLARRILEASIPDMVEEIGRLRERVANLESGMRGFESDCIELAAECEDADISPAERRTYRAFAASARAILAKSQEAIP